MPPTGTSRRGWTAVCCRTEEYTCSPALRRTRQLWALVVATASMLLLAPLPQQPATAAGLPMPTEPLSTSWLARTRGDENEGIENRHRTASVGFYIGDPCNQTCSRVLYHVFCNVTSRRCECRPEYPVNIDNRQCVKASSLGGHCDHDEACAFSVTHSSCQSNECRCLDGHEPDAHATKCTPTRGVAILENAELTTMVSVIVALMVFTALFCLVLRLFSKARFGTSGRDRMGDAASPPPGPAVLSSVDGSLAQAPGTKGPGPGSRRTSRNSVDYAASRRASCGMLAPPADSRSCSRRAGGSSVRSQTSRRSAASNRSGSLSRVGSRQTPAAAKGGAEGSVGVAATVAAAATTEISGTEDEDERVPPAPPPATVGGRRRKPPHEPVRGAASSPMEATRADPVAEQPITRPLRSPLSHDVRDKEVTGCATAPSFE